ncbi:hypothetical protein [Enterococcus phage IMEEF1]|uniref:Uncharacterized protein n=1 Tax=Enterococcus phage IMEEF1 TaxID=1351735 RepID=S5MX22_9CAUD|nr:hypothetical protein FDH83_gp44 [Enterococcus phage IMEEF1]AGR49027.1 hypothetical protein [Enterococcus phage IMEEF1]
MKSMYEQFKEGTLQAGQRVTFTGTVEEIDDTDSLFPVLVNIDGNGKMWLREGTFKYMEPADEKLYEVSIGGHLLSYYGSDYIGGVWNSFLWIRREVDSDILVQAFPMSFLEKHFPEAVAIAQEVAKEEV